MLAGLIVANNQRQLDNIGSSFHLSRKESLNLADPLNPTLTRDSVATADVTAGDTEAQYVAFANELKAFADSHFTDDVAHDSASSAAVTIADATDTASAIDLANELKANFNTHRTASNVHYTADETNTVTTADATDSTDLIALLNEIKEQINDHVASAPAGSVIEIIPA